MIVNNNFGKTIDLLHRTMSVSSLRQAVIANNLTNAEVPNFKRTDVNFESELKRALNTERQRPILELTRTNPLHIPNFQPMNYQDVQPRRVLDYLTQTNNNGNNVDPENEFNLHLKNQMRYVLLAQAATFEFSQVNMVLRA